MLTLVSVNPFVTRVALAVALTVLNNRYDATSLRIGPPRCYIVAVAVVWRLVPV
jgi:hypothetical protein